MGSTNIFAGSFPDSPSDVSELKENSISAVLNLQTKEEQDLYGIDWKLQLKQFYSNGVAVAKNFPVDFTGTSEEYAEQVFLAS